MSVSWPRARRQLPRALSDRLAPFLADRALADCWAAVLLFDAADAPLAELLAYAAGRQVQPSLLGRLAGDRQPPRPLLCWVRRWPVYEYAELAQEPVVQLVVAQQLALAPPLTASYRPELRRDALCTQCGSLALRQVADLALAPDAPWRPPVATANHELVIADEVYQRWRGWAAPPVRPVRLPDAVSAPAWQVLPQGVVALAEPETPLHVRTRCPACGRPTIVACHPPTLAGETVYEEERGLCLQRGALPDGDYWETTVQVGRIRCEGDLLARLPTDPEPFCVRTAEPFRLISGRLLRVLHAAQPPGAPGAGHWRCRPIRWAG